MSESDADDEQATPVQIRWFALVSLIGHLLLLGTGTYSLSIIGGHGWVAIVAAALFAVAYVGMWWILLAPGSYRRLGAGERFLWKIIVVPVVVVLAALGQMWLLALIGASFVFLGDALDAQRSFTDT